MRRLATVGRRVRASDRASVALHAQGQVHVHRFGPVVPGPVIDDTLTTRVRHQMQFLRGFSGGKPHESEKPL